MLKTHQQMLSLLIEIEVLVSCQAESSKLDKLNTSELKEMPIISSLILAIQITTSVLHFLAAPDLQMVFSTEQMEAVI